MTPFKGVVTSISPVAKGMKSPTRREPPSTVRPTCLKFSGLNSVGLRRNNFAPEVRKQIKQAYHFIYQSEMNRSQAVSQIKSEFNAIPEINQIIEFINNSDRGLV